MGTPTVAPRGTDHRRATTDDKLFQATLELLRDRGAEAVTVEAVAARSGVAKTTIYRRYPDRHAMLRDALDRCLPAIAVFDSDSPRSALICATRMMSSTIEHYLGTAFATILDRRQSPVATVIRDAFIQPRVEAMSVLLHAGLASGRLRAGIDASMVTDIIIGAIGAHYARFGGFDEGWPESFVAHLWPAIAACPEAARAEPEQSGRGCGPTAGPDHG